MEPTSTEAPTAGAPSNGVPTGAGQAAGGLASRIARVPDAGPDLALARSDLADALKADESGRLAAAIAAAPTGEALVLAAASDSPYLREHLFRRPERLARILADAPEARIAALVAELIAARPADEAAVMRAVRQAKQEAALVIALADLGGVWDVPAVTDALTRLADGCVRAGVRFILRATHAAGRMALKDPEDPEAGCGWIVLAMGKHGAFELNYSSDIDLIVFYDRDIAPVPAEADAATLFVRMTRQLVKILQERTADGYGFRTDLRLRPDPGATAIAVSVLAALQYYGSMGQNWERAAMIKARPCAGDIAAGEGFLKEIRPFVWRKYLDYAAIRDIHSIKRQIHAHKGHGKVAVYGHNVKLGRGGIREIEFFVQTQQLIAGGRNPDLRGRGTIAMLDALVAHGWLDAAARDDLAEAYLFLRAVEHRIQMVADEQTHTLPETPDGLARIGRMMGIGDAEAFAAALERRFHTVSGHYAGLFEEEVSLAGSLGNLSFTGDEDDPDTLATLAGLGYQRPDVVTRAVRAWHFGRYAATRSTRAREILTEITPALLAALAETDAADAAFTAFDTFLKNMPAGVQLFSLIAENKALLTLVATIMGTAPRLAGIVGRRPHVMDAVLEPAFFGTVPDAEELDRRLDLSLGESRAYEEVLDRARIFGQEQMFLIGVRVLSGTISARRAGAVYARLADVILARLLAATLHELEKAHGRVPGGRVALIAMGKLGGREMTAASDLDLILLYDHDPDATASDGARPLAPSQYFARATQRLVTALAAPTAEGKLYEVDFRLRPSGNAGPLATRVDAFARYQRADAWTWEHMALTRARVVAATGGLGGDVEAIIAETLARPRDPDAILADVTDMRARIEQEKGSADPWDMKVVPGGLIDIEFLAQTLQLLHASAHPRIVSTNTEATLVLAERAGVLSRADGEVLIPAIRLYNDLTQVLRLGIAGRFKPTEAPKGFLALVTQAGGMPSVETLEAHLRQTQAAVRAVFERVVGPVERRKG
ncbi:bifunctional [glutamine synthetase] adenylyltransferase/[glutamine synthetase]-adenylyl-L-tyrosine phosphorylase [Mongoliimonas terrestris]|uniref:bifunctional [glutamine synthetase] adenylyltransferase/[glutamine synthetase]-adenylyl-L-tyrosine phosphorylase n=1 Tax=Mongoliimonas terrestris TaxID=1709001 RepID=UPI0009F97405|nr:bifunctional [glutamine synthetase] adenylyltransferase/[glutamine synthetase]-adenylyl-L-tyrosine phosphorylase [Mongoliimonas terrestris]